MNWIRIACKISRSASIQRIATAARVKRNEALGCVVCVLCAMPDHASDGDLSATPSETIELWAGWDGKAGLFAAAFRAEMCDDSGVVRLWEEHNGKAIRRFERDRQRKSRGADTEEEPEEFHTLSTHFPQEFHKLSAGIPQEEMGYDTIRGSSRSFGVATAVMGSPPTTGPTHLREILPAVVRSITERAERARGLA